MRNNPGNNQEIASALVRIQEKLALLEQKIDILAGRMVSLPAMAKAPEARPVPAPVTAPVQKPVQPAQGNAARQGERNRSRQMFKAVCAECKNECELPFKPSGDRPVYCKECFAQRKAATTNKVSKPVPVAPAAETINTAPKPFTDVTPKATGPVQVYPVDLRSPAEKAKSAAKRAPVASRRMPAARKRPAAPAKKSANTQNKKRAR